jgi:hypothetical protein
MSAIGPLGRRDVNNNVVEVKCVPVVQTAGIGHSNAFCLEFEFGQQNFSVDERCFTLTELILSAHFGGMVFEGGAGEIRDDIDI